MSIIEFGICIIGYGYLYSCSIRRMALKTMHEFISLTYQLIQACNPFIFSPFELADTFQRFMFLKKYRKIFRKIYTYIDIILYVIYVYLK